MNDKEFIVEDELKKRADGRGGERVPGAGKSLGRPPVSPDIRRKQFTAKLSPETIQRIKALAGPLELSQGQVIDKAIQLLANRLE